MVKPVVLCIMDGVGIRHANEHNAVRAAHMPCFNQLLGVYPHCALGASGADVGLPDGIMGNSEVGHLTIGAGRVVNQFLRRFALENWDNNAPLADFIADVGARGGIVHFAGLMSDGRVHADIDGMITIMRRIVVAGLRVCVHFIADGRDTPPQSVKRYVDALRAAFTDAIADGRVFFGTISGRYYAMDRNNNDDRTRAAFNAIANAESEFHAPTIYDAIAAAYADGVTDEFIRPTVIDGDVAITGNDGFVFGNYRADRARQIVRAISTTGARMLTFAPYGEDLGDIPALLIDTEIKNTLGDAIAAAGLRQLRIAETEKYNHVTYFMDALRNIDYPGESKVLVPSPDVATFDMAPEMAAEKITDELLARLDNVDVVILNYANGDMVGHTGNMAAATRAMEFLDTQLARIVPAVLARGGALLITADHGNSEQMWDDVANAPHTAHTTNPVYFIAVTPTPVKLHCGTLADIAPTVLHLLGVAMPPDMTGNSLI